MRPYLLYFLDTSSLYLSLSSWKGFSLIAGVCAHTLAVLIDCLEIVLYLAIEFLFRFLTALLSFFFSPLRSLGTLLV